MEMESPAASEHGGVWTPETGDRRQFCPIFKLLLNFPQSIYNFFAATAFLRTLLNLSHRIRIRLSKTNCKNKFSISQMHFEVLFMTSMPVSAGTKLASCFSNLFLGSGAGLLV